MLQVKNKRYHHHYCSKALERVSIRNAKWQKDGDNTNTVPQNALIKLVRNAPSLRWFRSDLTQDNIDMLRLERPEIEFAK
ncbi:MAG: hypothetical protein ACI8RD_014834 [Bacillariaceae sp.]|jgi:hypothetical protein